MIKHIYLAAFLAALIVLGGIWYLQSDRFSGITHLSGLEVGDDGFSTTASSSSQFSGSAQFNGTLGVAGAITATGTAALATTSVTGNLSVTGTSTAVREFTQGGGILNISTTSATYTLTQAEMLNNNVIEIEAIEGGAGQAALALTLPATSTLVALIPNAGDMREWVIEDNHTAAATTTTVTAGTGIDLIGVTTADDVIDGGELARLTCWRKETTDVACITSELLAAD